MLKKIILGLALCLGLTSAVAAQSFAPGPGPVIPPCTAFGTAAGTCAQGNDSRITGATQATSGTWTPANANATMTINNAGGVAAYYAAGKLFSTMLDISWVSASGTGVSITGLPVTSAANSYQFGLCTSSIGVVVLQVGPSSSTVNMTLAATGGAVTNVSLTGTRTICSITLVTQ